MKTLKITLLFCLISVLSFAEVSQTQKAALVDLYTATNGDSWNHSWNLEQPVSKWYGLTIEDDNVVAIDLSFNNLNGNLPESISNLTHLKVLNLSFNKLEGELPTTLVNMVSLTELKLFSNQFNGAIPSRYWKLN